MSKLKIINDPVYGFIHIPNEDIYDLIQSVYVQRLRRIKQLGLSSLVYPCAEHTRFSHSIGAMYLVERALNVLRNRGVDISDDEYFSSLTAILLHDSGHAPFSHCLENFFFNCSHEDISSKFMNMLGVDGKVLQIFEDKYPKRFLHQLVSSQIDVDRLDYLTRDSFFTGVSEGVIGTDRIIHMYSVKDDELVIDEKGIYSIEKFIISRRLMYWQVYMHKTVVGADELLRKILLRASDLCKRGELLEKTFPVSEHLLYFLKNGASNTLDKESISHFLLVDDTDVWSSVKTWSMHSDRILSYLATRLMNRDLGHIKIKSSPYSKEEVDDNVIRLYENHKSGDFKADKFFSVAMAHRYFASSNELHNKAYSFNDFGINILYKDGTLKPIYEASDQLDKSFLSKEIRKYYYFEL